jgi:cadmium resistance protein CadD (predicted permease)
MVLAMAPTLQTAATAVGLFAGTNVDDIVVLSVLNVSRAAENRPRHRDIWIGQYLGIAVLVLIALAASRGLSLIRPDLVGLLGLIPLTLGLYRLAVAIRTRDRSGPTSTPVAAGLVGVVGITVANGGDNVAAYTPVFATQSASEIAVTITVFALCVAVWCLAAALLVTHKRVVAAIEACGHWLVPPVYITIGLWVLSKTGLLGLV